MAEVVAGELDSRSRINAHQVYNKHIVIVYWVLTSSKASAIIASCMNSTYLSAQ